MKKPELLLPAGNFEKMKTAFDYGADAVFAGVPFFSLRARENQFQLDSVREAIEYTRKIGKTIYLTLNIVPHNVKIKPLEKAIPMMAELKPDAFIVSDPGVIDLCLELSPEIPLHLSVQANNVNYAAIKFWHKQGIKRVILSREISIKEIKEIHEKVPEVELETFVHGAICMAYSGRCLLSNYMTYRDANQGTCAHSCRWQYKVYKAKRQATSNIQHQDKKCRCEVQAKRDELTHDGVFDLNYVPIEGEYYLEEQKRPGEFMEIDEDEYGTYIMNSRDFCGIEYLKELVDAGVISFKVEGRSKSIYYAGSVARTYRKAIDEMAEGIKPTFDYVKELAKTANRGFIPGFLVANPKEKAQYYEKNAPLQTHKFMGVIRRIHKDGWAEVEMRNRMEKGDIVEVMGFKYEDDFSQAIAEMKSIRDEEIDTAHGGAGNILVKFSKKIYEGMMLRMECS
jgi:U32 family peptidase